MYGGITRGLVPIVALKKQPGLVTYRVKLTPELTQGLQVGSSISFDGVCQTVKSIEDNTVECHAMAETLARTTISDWEEGRLVSVDRSLGYGEEIGGHEVAGHVIGIATVVQRNESENNLSLTLQVPSEWMKYIQFKGFIAVDGSSLTVGKTDPAGRFDIHLIPETLRVTNFGKHQVGDKVNIELDHRTVTIVDTVERILAERESQIV